MQAACAGVVLGLALVAAVPKSFKPPHVVPREGARKARRREELRRPRQEEEEGEALPPVPGSGTLRQRRAKLEEMGVDFAAIGSLLEEARQSDKRTGALERFLVGVLKVLFVLVGLLVVRIAFAGSSKTK